MGRMDIEDVRRTIFSSGKISASGADILATSNSHDLGALGFLNLFLDSPLHLRQNDMSTINVLMSMPGAASSWSKVYRYPATTVFHPVWTVLLSKCKHIWLKYPLQNLNWPFEQMEHPSTASSQTPAIEYVRISVTFQPQGTAGTKHPKVPDHIYVFVSSSSFPPSIHRDGSVCVSATSVVKSTSGWIIQSWAPGTSWKMSNMWHQELDSVDCYPPRPVYKHNQVLSWQDFVEYLNCLVKYRDIHCDYKTFFYLVLLSSSL